MTDPSVADNVAEGIAAVRRAAKLTKQAIDSEPDLQRRVELNAALDKALAEELQDVHVRRDRMTADIWELEKLSLAKLAAKIGVSKARADQIIKEQLSRTTQRPDPPEE